METLTQANIVKNSSRYKFQLIRLSESLQLNLLLDGPESLEQYKSRARQEMAAYYHSVMLLQHRSLASQAFQLHVSIRTIQRYVHEFPLPDNLLELLYNIQIHEL